LTNPTRPQARLERTSLDIFPFGGKRCEATKVTIDKDDETTAKETRSVKPALVAELTWAKLYTKAMHQDLVAISTAVGKSRATTSGTEMKKGAEHLHDQLQDANRTVDELSGQAGIRPVPVKK
jgi:hypothetical protein